MLLPRKAEKWDFIKSSHQIGINFQVLTRVQIRSQDQNHQHQKYNFCCLPWLLAFEPETRRQYPSPGCVAAPEWLQKNRTLMVRIWYNNAFHPTSLIKLSFSLKFPKVIIHALQNGPGTCNCSIFKAFHRIQGHGQNHKTSWEYSIKINLNFILKFGLLPFSVLRTLNMKYRILSSKCAIHYCWL